MYDLMQCTLIKIQEVRRLVRVWIDFCIQQTSCTARNASRSECMLFGVSLRINFTSYWTINSLVVVFAVLTAHWGERGRPRARSTRGWTERWNNAKENSLLPSFTPQWFEMTKRVTDSQHLSGRRVTDSQHLSERRVTDSQHLSERQRLF